MALKLDLRQKQILEALINTNGFITGRSLAAISKVSDRTIRTDMRILDKVLLEYDIHIQAVTSKGYRVSKAAKQTLSQLMDGMASTEGIPVTPSERMIYYLSGLIFKETSAEVTDLEEQIYISHSTMEKDLISLQSWLSTFDLTLIKDRGFITLSGEEANIRYLILYLLDWHDYKVLRMSKEALDLMGHLYSKVDLFLRETLDQFITSLSGEAFRRLKHLLITSVFRINQRKLINDNYDKDQTHKSGVYYHYMKLLSEFSQLTHVKIHDAEKQWFETAFKKYVLLGHESNNSIIDGLFIKAIKETAMKLEQAYGITFSHNSIWEIAEILHTNLTNHDRLPFQVSKAFKQQEKGSPLAIEMTIDLFKMMMKQYQLFKNGEDFNQISTIISTEIEKTIAKKEWVAKRVMIVSDGDKNANDYLLARMKRYFPMLNVVDIIPSYRYKPHQFDDIIILSTNTQLETSHPVLMIHPMLKDYDRYRIKAFLHNTDSMHHMFVNLFREVLYFKEMAVKNPADAIRKICDESQSQGYGDSGLFKDTMEREQIKSTAIGNGVAIPHSMNPYISESVISVAVLKNSITWGREKVRLVMLIQIAEKQKRMMEHIFGYLMDLVSAKQQIDALIHTNNYYEFIKILSRQTRRNDEL